MGNAPAMLPPAFWGSSAPITATGRTSPTLCTEPYFDAATPARELTAPAVDSFGWSALPVMHDDGDRNTLRTRRLDSWRREAEPDAPALPAVPATPGSPDQLSSSATTVTTASPPSARAVGRALPVWRLEP
eukprot:EG_transcript_29093